MIEGLGERIRTARANAGMTQKDLAAAVGVKSRSVIGNWEQDVAEPSVNHLAQIAHATGASLSYLLNYESPQTVTVTSRDQQLLHLFHSTDDAGREIIETVAQHEYNRVLELTSAHMNTKPKVVRAVDLMVLPVSAGTGITLLDEEPPEPIFVPFDAVSEHANFVLEVRGDSMEPDYKDGDLILVQKADVIDEGQLGIFGVNGEGYFKKLGHNKLI